MQSTVFNSINPSIMPNIQKINYTQNAQSAAAAKISAPAQDEFIPSTKKEEEKKTSTAKKAGIAAGVIIGLTAIGLIVRGKLKAVTKLAENIEFTPAKTMEEAREFAKKHLKIENFDTADDLELANWVNDGLVRINNKYKGRAYIPDEVLPYPKELAHDGTLAGMKVDKRGLKLHSTLYVNVEKFNGNEKAIERMLSKEKGFYFQYNPETNVKTMLCLPFFSVEKSGHILTMAQVFKQGKMSKVGKLALEQNLADYTRYYEIFRDNPVKILENMYNQKTFMDLMKKYLPANEIKSLDELKKLDKAEVKKYIWKVSDKIRKNTPQKDWPSAMILDAKRSACDTLFHEEGHLFHKKNALLDYEDMHVGYDKNKKEIGELAKEFVESPEEQFIASTVSNYAKHSPLEFVAEVYARIMNGHKFSDDVMKLYEKYKGPKLPENMA